MAATTATATAPAAATAATVAPWRDAREWLAVKQQLAAPTAPAHAQQQGLRRVAAWKARGRLPLAVECTAGLVAAQLQDRSPPARAAAGDTAARHSVRQTYAMALVRFVNGFADAAQRRVAARRVHAAAAELGLPAWLVDLRHDATHGALPGLPILRRACQTALQWLREVYWQPQAEAARSRQTAARAHLRTFAALRREARAPRDGTADDDVQRARQHKSRGLQALEAVAQLYPPDQVSALAEVLLGRELLLQPPPPPPVLTEGVTEAETLKQVVADWKPALAFFAARAPALASWLLHSLLERLLVAAEDESSGDQGNEDLGVALIATWCSVVLQLAGGHIETHVGLDWLAKIVSWLAAHRAASAALRQHVLATAQALAAVIETRLAEKVDDGRESAVKMMKRLNAFLRLAAMDIAATTAAQAKNEAKRAADDAGAGLVSELLAKRKKTVAGQTRQSVEEALRLPKGWRLSSDCRWATVPLGCLADGSDPQLTAVAAAPEKEEEEEGGEDGAEDDAASAAAADEAEIDEMPAPADEPDRSAAMEATARATSDAVLVDDAPMVPAFSAGELGRLAAANLTWL